MLLTDRWFALICPERSLGCASWVSARAEEPGPRLEGPPSLTTVQRPRHSPAAISPAAFFLQNYCLEMVHSYVMQCDTKWMQTACDDQIRVTGLHACCSRGRDPTSPSPTALGLPGRSPGFQTPLSRALVTGCEQVRHKPLCTALSWGLQGGPRPPRGTAVPTLPSPLHTSDLALAQFFFLFEGAGPCFCP